jgi:hypothetical protein
VDPVVRRPELHRVTGLDDQTGGNGVLLSSSPAQGHTMKLGPCSQPQGFSLSGHLVTGIGRRGTAATGTQAHQEESKEASPW